MFLICFILENVCQILVHSKLGYNNTVSKNKLYWQSEIFLGLGSQQEIKGTFHILKMCFIQRFHVEVAILSFSSKFSRSHFLSTLKCSKYACLGRTKLSGIWTQKLNLHIISQMTFEVHSKWGISGPLVCYTIQLCSVFAANKLCISAFRSKK